MKKFIYKHGKIILCFLTVLSIITSTVTIISAADDEVSNPDANKPTVPEDSLFEYTMYFPGGYGYNAPQPIYDLVTTMTIHNDVVGSTLYNSFTVTSDRVKKTGDSFSTVESNYSQFEFDVLRRTTVIGSNTGEIPMHYNYSIDNSIELSNGYAGFLYFNCGNFYFFPYYDYSANIRSIFDLRFSDTLNADSAQFYNVNCTFSFIGNNRVHQCNFSARAYNGDLYLSYEDILRNSDIDYSTSDPYIPIYIRDFYIIVDIVDTSDVEYEVRVPVMSSDESNGVAIDKSYLFRYTLSNYELGMPLDLTWIINGVNGFFNAPFLGVGLTLGTITMVALTVSLGVIILKFLSHLK